MEISEEPPFTFHYAPEIERSTVSLLWHEPQRCPHFFRDLDPGVHLREPLHRITANAVNLAWAELGATDWATVVQVVRELGHYEECGGADGLNSVYAAKMHRAGSTDRLWSHYIQMLKTYALARRSSDYYPVARFSGGSGFLKTNKNKRNNGAPDLLGTLQIAGRSYWASAWVSTAGVLLKVLPT